MQGYQLFLHSLPSVVGVEDKGLFHQGGGGPAAGAVDARGAVVAQASDQLGAICAADCCHRIQCCFPAGSARLAVDVAVATQSGDRLGHGGVQFVTVDHSGEAVLAIRALVEGLLPARVDEDVAGQSLGQSGRGFVVAGFDAHAVSAVIQVANGHQAERGLADDHVVVGAFGTGDMLFGCEHDVSVSRLLRVNEWQKLVVANDYFWTACKAALAFHRLRMEPCRC